MQIPTRSCRQSKAASSPPPRVGCERTIVQAEIEQRARARAMAGAFEWLLWRVLHLLFSLACALHAVFSRSRGFISSSFKAENCQVQAIVADKPLTVAVVLESQEALDKDGKIPQLLSWLSAANVSHVTLYDAQGEFRLPPSLPPLSPSTASDCVHCNHFAPENPSSSCCSNQYF